MKKSNIAMLIVFLALIPLTLFLGDKLPGKGYYITGVLIIIELSVPFFMAFEKIKPLVFQKPIEFMVEVTERTQLPNPLSHPHINYIDGRTYKATGNTVEEAFFKTRS